MPPDRNSESTAIHLQQAHEPRARTAPLASASRPILPPDSESQNPPRLPFVRRYGVQPQRQRGTRLAECSTSSAPRPQRRTGSARSRAPHARSPAAYTTSWQEIPEPPPHHTPRALPTTAPAPQTGSLPANRPQRHIAPHAHHSRLSRSAAGSES